MQEMKSAPTSSLLPLLNSEDYGSTTVKVERIEPDTSSNTSTHRTGTVPSATCKLPCREDYPGPYNFNVLLNADTSSKNGWLFSVVLNKVFVSMLSKVSFQFKWIQKEHGLYVRAMLVYCSEDHFERPVLRCPNHSSPHEPCNIGFPHVQHVIRCDHDHAEYHKNPHSNRLSVVVPMDRPHPGTDWVTVVYRFLCKNSCNVGMNRRATSIIFTLERADGEVIGRKSLGLRVCSVPKRDKEKEERDLISPPQYGRRPPHPSLLSITGFEPRRQYELESKVDGSTNFTPGERAIIPDKVEEDPSGETENEMESDSGEPDTDNSKYLRVRKASFLLPPNKRKPSGSPTRDEYCVFGEHIAMRLRNIQDGKVRLLVQKKISNILFEGEMTNYGHELKLYEEASEK